MKRTISIVLSLVMLIGILTGCGSATMDEINKNTNIVVASIGDEDIYAYEMIYLMKMGYPKEEALEEVSALKASVIKAKENGITFAEEDNTVIEEQMTELATQFGGEDVLLSELENLGITKDQYKEIMRLSLMVERLNERVIELGLFTEVSDDEVRAFYDENFLRSQHILLSTIDAETNAKLSDDVIAQKKAQAEDIVKKIRAGAAFEDFLSLSEDPGLESSPNGYTFLNSNSDSIKSNELMLSYFQQAGIPIMVESFEAGTAALDNGTVSEVIESDFGFHIIKRLDLHGQGNEYEEMKSYIAGVLNNMNYNSLVNTWKSGLKQKTNKYYEALEVEPATHDHNNTEQQAETQE